MKAKSCERFVEFVIPAEKGREAFESAARKVQKTAEMKGFRKGKIPLDIVKKRFRDKILETVIRTYVVDALSDEIKNQGIETIDLPYLEDVDFQDDFSIKVKAKLYVWPSIKLPNYKKLKIKKKDDTVSESEVKETIKRYRKALLPVEKQGEDIDEKDLPELTDEAVKKWGFESVEQLVEDVKRRLEENKKTEVKKDIDRQIREFLLKNSRLDVPDPWIERQLESKIKNMAETLASIGMNNEQIINVLEPRKDDLRASAEDDVKLFFIIEEIARKEGIEASDEEIDVQVEEVASRYGMSKDDLVNYYKTRGKWDDFCLQMDHDKVWNYLVNIGVKK